MNIHSKYKTIRDPFVLVINDFLSKEDNEAVLNEAIQNEKFYVDAEIGNGLDKTFRNNKVAFYDEIYQVDRTKSKLLSILNNKFDRDNPDTSFREILSSCPDPIDKFVFTNRDQNHVSRYGGDKSMYKWHIDRFENVNRVVTLVYYFFKEPKMFTGGELQVTNSPIVNGQTIEENPLIHTIEPKNNMAVIFSSTVPHRVLNTKSSDKFDEGRFSLNCWIGFK